MRRSDQARQLFAGLPGGLALCAATLVELRWRQVHGGLIGLPGDFGAALLHPGLGLVALGTLLGPLVLLLSRRSLGLGAGALVVAVDLGLRVLLAEAWLGAAAEAGASPAVLPGLVYVGLLPTLASAATGWIAGRLPRAGVAGAWCGLALGAVLLLVRPASPHVDRVGPNLLLVTIDTWRYDHLSAHPDALAPDLTPQLDALAARSTLYTEARSPASITVPAHVAMLSGREPWQSGVQLNSHGLPADLPWLPADLRAQGYRTGAVVSGAVLRGRDGLARGFDRFHDDLVEPAGVHELIAARLVSALLGGSTPVFRATAPRALRRARAFLNSTTAPWFLWVHLYDVHTPHGELSAAPELVTGLPDPCAWRGHPSLDFGGPLPTVEARRSAFERRCARTDEYRRAIAGYGAEVRRADAAAGELLDLLEARGEADQTVVIVAADHGEALVEHGQQLSHQQSPYEAVQRVPLLVHVPGRPPAVSGSLVSLTGLAPTARSLLGLPAGGATWDEPRVSVGSLLRLTSTRPDTPDRRVTVRTRDRALIATPDRPDESYDLRGDPHQLHADAPTLPELRRAAGALLAAEPEAPTARLDAAQLEALRALGYVE